MSTEKLTDRFHRESLEGVDAVLGRMCQAIEAIPGIGYAEALDVSRDTVKTWRRRGEVSMKYLTGFAKAHDVSLDYLRYGAEVRNEPVLSAGISESSVHQAVLDAVEFLSLEKKVDVEQLAKTVVKLSVRYSEWAKLAVPALKQGNVSTAGEGGMTVNKTRAKKQTIVSVGTNHGQTAEKIVNKKP